MNEQEYNVTRRLFSAIFVLVSITVIDFSFPSGLQLEGLLPHFLVRCRSGMCTRSTTGVQTSWLSSLRYGVVAFGIAAKDIETIHESASSDPVIQMDCSQQDGGDVGAELPNSAFQNVIKR